MAGPIIAVRRAGGRALGGGCDGADGASAGPDRAGDAGRPACRCPPLHARAGEIDRLAACAWPGGQKSLGPSFADLPQLAPLVHDGKVQTEQIQAARPDVILDYGSTSPRYTDRATMVQKATGIPVLLLDGKLERTPETYRLLGAILGTERAADLAPPSACSRSPARGLRRGVKQGRSGSITPAARTGSRPRPRPLRWVTCSAAKQIFEKEGFTVLVPGGGA